MLGNGSGADNKGAKTVAQNKATEPAAKQTLQDSSLGPIISACCEALQAEIEAARSDLARLFTITAGEKLSGGEDESFYQFKSDIAIPVPTDTPVTIYIEKEQPVRGTLVGLQDFDIFISISRDLGEHIPKAKLSSQPEFIWQALIDRLRKLGSQEAPALTVPLSLVDRETPPQISNEAAATAALVRLKKLNNPSFYPNEDQQKSMGLCAGRPIHYVWGPPGTGKTVNLAQVALTLATQGERVLVLAHSNAAVDVAVLRIADVFEGSTELNERRILRLGIPQLPAVRGRGDITPEDALKKTHPDLVKRRDDLEKKRNLLTQEISKASDPEEKKSLAEALNKVRKELRVVREEIRTAITQIVADAKILCCTLSRFTIDDQVFLWPADAILVDEASMAPFPAVFMAGICARKRMVIFGDFRQLPPIFLSSKKVSKDWMGRDPFEIAGIVDSVESNRDDPRVTLLGTQYRMACQIADLVSDLAYGGQLKTGDKVNERNTQVTGLSPCCGHSAILIDTSALDSVCVREPRSGSYSRVNPIHAALAFELADSLLNQGCPNVAIVTPYRAQAKLITSFLHGYKLKKRIQAFTVHRFQGSESEAVIVDMVDGPPMSGASQLTGKERQTSLRLLNVALSRAKGKLLVLANEEFIRRTHKANIVSGQMCERMEARGTKWKVSPAEIWDKQQNEGVRWYDGWQETQAMAIRILSLVGRDFQINLPHEMRYSDDFLLRLCEASSRVSHSTVFANPKIAQSLEDSPADLRLMTRPGGFFLLADETRSLVGGPAGSGAFFYVESGQSTNLLREILMGEEAKGVGPQAELRHALDSLCGRCPECGEFRRPQKSRGAQWKLACKTEGHSSLPLEVESLKEMLSFFTLKCAKCGGDYDLREGPRGLFLGCRNYRKGCPGDFPSLETLFEEN